MWKKGLILFISTVIVIVPVFRAVIITNNDIQICNDFSDHINGGGYTNITVWDALNITQSKSDGNQIPIDVRRNDEWIPEY